MEISITLIRGGMTRSGELGRYMGVMDEPLCRKGIARLTERKNEGCYPVVDCVFAASARRCLETAPLIYPGQPAVVVGGFSTFDYGAFEGKTYQEMESIPDFEKWVTRQEKTAQAQDFHSLTYRNIAVFRDIVGECVRKDIERIAVITHRLAILAIVRSYCVPRPTYQAITVDCGGGMTILYDNHRDSAKIAKTI